MQNLHQLFDWQYIGQIIGGDFAKFCGFLRIYELYNVHLNFDTYSMECPIISVLAKAKLFLILTKIDFTFLQELLKPWHEAFFKISNNLKKVASRLLSHQNQHKLLRFLNGSRTSKVPHRSKRSVGSVLIGKLSFFL